MRPLLACAAIVLLLAACQSRRMGDTSSANELAAYAARRNARAEELRRVHPGISSAQIAAELDREFPRSTDTLPLARRQAAAQSKFEDELGAMMRKK